MFLKSDVFAAVGIVVKPEVFQVAVVVVKGLEVRSFQSQLLLVLVKQKGLEVRSFQSQLLLVLVKQKGLEVRSFQSQLLLVLVKCLEVFTVAGLC